MAKNNNLGDFLTDIANAIRTKKGTSGTIPAQDFSDEILSIQGGGGGVVDEYFYYAKSYYTITNNATLFPNAWQDSENSKTVLYDIPLTLAATEQNFLDFMTVDYYVGTDGALEQLYNDCVNGVIPLPKNEDDYDVYLVNNETIVYMGDFGSLLELPAPLYSFSGIESLSFFMIGDLTELGMGSGITLLKLSGVSIPNNNIIIQQGFEFKNENGIILPNSVTSIEGNAFENWASNNQPLTIPNSVTRIGIYAFRDWTSNNQPLVIPDSVTSIGEFAFYNWTSNTHPLVIPDGVTSIGEGAFRDWSLVPYVEMKAVIPPSLAGSDAFDNQNNAPIYVPDESLDDYKTATNWVDLANRIFPISEKP